MSFDTVAVFGFPEIDGDWVKLEDAKDAYAALEEKLEHAELSWKANWERADKSRAQLERLREGLGSLLDLCKATQDFAPGDLPEEEVARAAREFAERVEQLLKEDS